ncbi:MAG TPA: DNA gyrase subunit A [Clostridiales bacterium]|nr:MAG: DNA gyrase subunit A [Clostridiales bacterium GWD2_32_59]HAN09090.1 DNA gyrase subunit A [Clostridiales bacterium]
MSEDINDDDMGMDKIISVEVEDEMRKSFISYAMSVIVSRALPDVRDGLKPVHRRIIYAMHHMGFFSNKPYKKCAMSVGEVMGKYHPHGDASIYNTLVNLAQDFSTRYMLIDGHGNFGSMDGDSAAAMRYTEARLSKISDELLKDIGKDTVDFKPNYSEDTKEPTVLPSRFPNLLVNGSMGIAVGMATKIPPHNLREVVDAIIRIIDNHIENNSETDIEELMEIVTGPDFPTGATILGTKGIKDAYRTGRGSIVIRSVCDIEESKNGKQRIIVSEIPYQVNKANLIEKIADLVKDKRIEGISDLRDESDRENKVRIVIELKRDANANIVLNTLYKHTQLQESFGVNSLALVNYEPKVLNLKQMLEYYLEHQKDVETRRIKFDLAKAEARKHILEGLIIALDNIDEVIKIIRASEDTTKAKENLSERFGLTELQAQAIVDMRLKALTGLERDKLDAEFAELEKLVNELKEILGDENKLYEVIKNDLIRIKNEYGDDRRTEITFDSSEINIEDMIKRENCAITMTHLGYIKRLPASTYKAQHRGGKGIKGMNTREEDFIENIFIASSHSYLMFFTNKGNVYRLKAYEIPESARIAKGTNIVNLLELNPEEKISAVIPIASYEEGMYLMMATKTGLVKRTSIIAYQNVRKGGLIAVSLQDNDELIRVSLTDGSREIFLATKKGMGIRFKEEDVRNTGRNTKGVRGIRLKNGDEVIDMAILEEDKEILMVTENGLGKRCNVNNFHLQNRGGKGLKTHKITAKTGVIVNARILCDEDELMIITSEGIIIRLRATDISNMGRATQGVKLINLDNDVKVVAVARVKLDQIDGENIADECGDEVDFEAKDEE